MVGRPGILAAMPPPRLDRLPARRLPGGLRLLDAATCRARLLGLAGLRSLEPGTGVLLRPCAAVHTVGMRFPLDVAFLTRDGAALRVVRGVGPRRSLRCAGAAAVLETRAGEVDAFLAALPARPATCEAAKPPVYSIPSRSSSASSARQ